MKKHTLNRKLYTKRDFCFKRGTFSGNLNQRCSNFPYLTTCPMGRLWLGGGGYTAGDNNIGATK